MLSKYLLSEALVTGRRRMFNLAVTSGEYQNHACSVQRAFFSSSALSSKQSDSVNEFIGFLDSTTERLAPLRKGRSWVSSNKGLHNVVKEHFPHVEEELFAPNVPNHVILADKRLHVVSSNNKEAYPESYVQAANVSIGGFPALFSAYIQSVMFKNGMYGNSKTPPYYVMPKDLEYSASFGNSGQFHISHAAPMSAPLAHYFGKFDAPRIAVATLLRYIKGEEPRDPNYMIAEIAPEALFEFNTWRVGVNYWGGELGYKTRRFIGLPTILDETIPLAKESGNVMENLGEVLGQPILHRDATLRVANDSGETAEMVALATFLRKYNVACWQISPEEAYKKSGTFPLLGDGGSIWEIPEDGRLASNVVSLLREGIENNGGRVIEGTVQEVVYDEGKHIVKGVSVTDDNDDLSFIESNRVYTSLGADSIVINHGVKDYKPIEPVLKGTGYSAFLLLKGKTPITRPVDENNTHFTPCGHATAEDGNVWTILRSTCGGVIGSERFAKDHAKNSLFIAELMFPAHEIHIVRARGCSRSLNGKNSVEIRESLPGVINATGWGGTGMTYAARIAADIALKFAEQNATDYQETKSFVERLRANPRYSDGRII